MKLWGSRLQKNTDSLVDRFNASIGFDRRLWAADIRGSVAYAQALERAGLITTEERNELLHDLEMVQAGFAEGRFQIQPTDEDIHTKDLREDKGPLFDAIDTWNWLCL